MLQLSVRDRHVWTLTVRRMRWAQSATTWRADAERHRPTAAYKIRQGTWLLLVVECHDESIMIGTGLEMVHGTVPASGVVPRSNKLVVS